MRKSVFILGKRRHVSHALIGVAIAGASCFMSKAARADVLYFDGFESPEVNGTGWAAFGGGFNATQTPSGTNGITAAHGSYYGVATGTGAIVASGDASSAATDYGQVAATFPAGGYTTSLSIYLDTSANQTAANDTRFDWDTGLNNSSGGFLRDFVFNAGFYTSADNTDIGSGNRFIISASNNADRANSEPDNPGRDPFVITTSGWYTFQDTFSDVGGDLQAVLSISNATGNVLTSWTLNDGDPISSVGALDYGWFPTNEFSSLAIDDSSVTTVPEPASLGLVTFACVGLLMRRRRRA